MKRPKLRDVGLLLAFGAIACSASDWPMLYGGADRNAVSAETGLLKEWPKEGPTLLWRCDELGASHASPVVSGGLVYVAGHGSTIALRAADGKVAFQIPAGGQTTPACDGQSVYLQFSTTVCRFSAKDGKAEWKVDLQQVLPELKTTPFQTRDKMRGLMSPAVDARRVYVALGHVAACVAALNKEDGKLAWVGRCDAKFSVQAPASPLAVRQGKTELVIAATGNGLVGFRADSGELLWERAVVEKQCQYGNSVTPAFHKGFLFSRCGYLHMAGAPEEKDPWTTYRLSADGTSLKPAWHNVALLPWQENAVCMDGRMYVHGVLSWPDALANPELLVNGRPFREVEGTWFAPRPKQIGEREYGRAIPMLKTAPPPQGCTGLACVDIATGRMLGIRFPESGRTFSGFLPAYADGMLYAVASWSFRTLYLMEATPAMTVRGTLVLPIPEEEREGKHEGKTNWAWTWGFSAPAIAEGKLFVRYGKHLFAYDIGLEK